VFSWDKALDVGEADERNDTSCCSQREQKVCPELRYAWHVEFPDCNDGEQSHDPVGSCV
jgi:hypothetical protein